ncbi:MAG: hypothetical protein CVV21_08600 [Candidatus Goldiibacteriota bacterium HGW-Goldbacteria-1]|jgi:acyl-ACP thioesterase|nr:MAG: hypothetical protein CVV21_08600 [Candidatus Goldiibacteriota bacterium HGW-Goldbacteria-1]
MEQAPGIWTEKYDVNVYDADINGRLKITALCNYLQNTAWRHYSEIEKVKGAMLKSGHIWAMMRLEVEIYKTAAWGNKLTVETWSKNVGKVSAFRDYDVTDENGIRIAAATTTWVVIDPVTKKIQPLKSVAEKWPEQKDKSAIGREAGKVEAVLNPVASAEYKVKFGEFDVNRHVNNVSYIDWMNETLTKEYLETHEVKSLLINFMEEAEYGGRVTAVLEKKDENTFACAVIKKESGKEAARGRFVFK